MTKLDDTSRKFVKALESLEGAMRVEALPGAVETWCSQAIGAIDHLGSLMPLNLESHQVTYEQIIEDNPGLAHRVKQLRDKDAHVREQLGRFKKRLEQLKQAGMTGRYKGKTLAELDTVRNDMLSWIANCRAQDIAVETWLLEAYYREDGAGD